MHERENEGVTEEKERNAKKEQVHNMRRTANLSEKVNDV